MAKSGSVRAGRAFVELGLEKGPFVRGLRSAEKDLKSFGASVRNVGAGIAAVGASITTAFAGAAKVFSDAGDALDKAAIRTGVSVEALSGLAFAAEQSESNIEELENAIRFMQRAIVEASAGTQGAVDALATLGLTAEQLLRLSPEDQFKAVADGLAAIHDPTRRAAAALEVFSRSGTKMLPLVEGGAAGIEALQRQFDSFGATVTTADAKLAALLNDTWNEMIVTLKALTMQVGAAVAPAFIDAAKAIRRAASVAIAWVRDNRALIDVALKVGVAITAIGGALVGLGVSIQAAGFVVGGLATGFVAVGAAISAIASPLGLIASAAAIAGAALYRWTDVGGQALSWLGDQVGELWKRFKDFTGGLTKLLLSGRFSDAANFIAAAFRVGFESIAVSATRVWSGIVDTIYGAMDDVVLAHENAVHEVTRLLLRLGTALDRSKKILEAKTFHFFVTLGIKEQELRGADPRSIADARKVANEALAHKIATINAESDKEIAALLKMAEEEHSSLISETRLAADERYKKNLEALERDQEALKKTRDAYRKALEEAEAVEIGDGLFGAFKHIPGRAFDFDVNGALNGARQSTFGTFNAAGVAGLGPTSLLSELNARMEKLFNEARKTNELLRTHGGRSITFS